MDGKLKMKSKKRKEEKEIIERYYTVFDRLYTKKIKKKNEF